MVERIGFIGIGKMGSPMAARLQEAGYPLTVFDTNAAALQPFIDAGAKRAMSPAEVASEAEIVLASLPTPEIVAAVALGADGVIEGKKIRTFVNLSTTGSRAATTISKSLGERGIVLLDAPVSGGPAGARKGKLAVMVSGPRETFARAEPVLTNLGKLFLVGETAGLAQTLKLINNLMSVTALAVTSEAMVLGVKAGLDAKTMIETLNASTGRNSATEDKFPRAVLPGTFDFGFATALSRKDIGLCLAEAEALGVPMIIGSVTRQILGITEAMYGGDSDFTSIAKVFESWTGVEVRG